MLPTFVYEFDAVAIRVQHVGGVVARVVVETDAGFAVVCGSGCDGCGVGGFDLLPAAGYKADMRGAGSSLNICLAFTSTTKGFAARARSERECF